MYGVFIFWSYMHNFSNILEVWCSGESTLVKLLSFTCISSVNLVTLIGINSMKGSAATTRDGGTRKRSTKRLKHTRNLLIKGACYSRLKATQIFGQRKEFYQQTIPDASCVRREIVDLDTLVTSRNCNRKIIQQTFLENKEVEPIEPIQMNICQNIADRRELNWLHF